MKKQIFLLLALAAVIVSAVFALQTGSNSDPLELQDIQCSDNGLFYENTNHESLQSGSQIVLDSNGNMQYLFDDFADYTDNQIIIDGFESTQGWVTDPKIKLSKSDEFYGGFASLQLEIPSGIDKLSLSKEFEKPIDLIIDDSGFITMWINTSTPQRLDEIKLTLVDENGNLHPLETVINVDTTQPNTLDNDDEYPDIAFPYGDPKREQWTDFMIGPGWNFVFWHLDSADFGIGKIILEMKTDGLSHILLDDLRIQDGLQRESNITEGFWYPPHGRPQYGIYDIDVSDGESSLRLLNVKNSQYPSNGDHARMISSAPVPEDFVMRVNFTFLQLGVDDIEKIEPEMTDLEKKRMLLDNTWFRVTYDFEPTWDPGHDWFGAYLSMEYDKFGLVTVWPVERNKSQQQEPTASQPTADQFTVQNGVNYEVHLLVDGQNTSAVLYEVVGPCLEQRADISYTFERKRHEERYPFALESTGNVRTIIHEVELIKT